MTELTKYDGSNTPERRTPADVTKRDSNPERAFTPADGYAGPVLADITCPDGVVHVTVDPAATVAAVRVLTRDAADSPAGRAVRETSITQTRERLVVVVPPVPGGGGMSSVPFGGGSTFVNGVRYSGNVTVINGQVFGGSGGAANVSTGVEVHVTLPAASAVRYRSTNGSLNTHGELAAIEATAGNGSIRAEAVGRLKATATNGSIKAGRVGEWVDAEAENGSVKVDQYAGRACRVRASNGSVVITATPAASGRIEARAGNGKVKLYGVRGRSDLDVDATAGNGTVEQH